MYRIIGLDPGGTTGWAVLTITEPNPLSPDYSLTNPQFKSEWVMGQLGPHEHHTQLYNLLETQHVQNTFVVSESFEYRNDSRPGLVLISSEYIGVTKLFCRERQVPLWLQTASEGKVRNTPSAFVKPANLKALGLYQSSLRHANDAIGHILYWMINTMKNDPISPVDSSIRKDLLHRGWR
jgi:hypothetical protein